MNRGVFNEKVDPVKFQCLDYFNVIKTPMDLGTVKQNLQAMNYKDDEEFSRDVRLTFQNALRYNPAEHYVHQAAKQLLGEFESDFDKMQQRKEQRVVQEENHSCSLCQGHTCHLCGEKCLKFDPPVLTCAGSCGQNIRRGAFYYR
jgi:hypothetical protein